MKIPLLLSLRYLLILSLLLVGLMPSSMFAQKEKIVPRSQSSTMEGRHFYVGFMRNEIDENRSFDKNQNDSFMYLMVYIGATEKTQVTFRYPWETVGTKYNIDGDSVLTIEIPTEYYSTLEMKNSELPTYGIVEITTDKKTIVYAMNTTRLSTDAYSALPVTSWGKEYVVVSVPNDTYYLPSRPIDTIPRSSEFMIMASEDSTLVQFTPTSETAKGKTANQLVSFYLMKGQSYLVMSSQKLGRGLGDMTGTIIRSDKPIGVISGHVRTSIPMTGSEPLSYTKLDSKDHIMDMLLPTKIWGTYYISTPFNIYSAGDLIRVVSIQPNTKVTAIGNNIFRDFVLANPGDVEDFYPVGVPVVWIADKPIQIAQFMPTSLQDLVQKFDPCMVILPPTEQFVSRILFEIPSIPIPGNQEYFDNYVNIVCERAAVNSITLDGTKLLSKYPTLIDQQIPFTQYNWLVVPVTPGVHDFKADTGRFSGIIYGTAQEDSYALSLGLSLLKTSFPDSTPPSFTFRSNCDKIHVTATEIPDATTIGLEDVVVIKDSTFNYIWKIDSSTEVTTSLSVDAEPIDITKNGQIIIEARDKLGYGRQLKYVYNALSIEVRNDIVFKAVNWKDSTCEKVIIKNNGVDTITFLSSAILGDSRVNFDGIIPLINQRIAPNDSVIFIVCFKPKNDSSALKASLILSLPCNRQISIPISGQVAAPSLMVTNWDFGRVLLGDTSCTTVYIINNGNIPISLQKLNLSPLEPTFDFDTLGLFPLTLQAGDSVPISVCYAPNVRRVSTVIATVSNSFNLPNSSQIVTGEGVAPLVEDVRINWGKKRQGTINDSLVILVNKGNYNADLKYNSTVGDAVSFSSLIQLQLPTTLPPNDTISIPARFIPYQVGVAQSEITLSVSNWKLHTPVKIVLEGEGIIPEVSTVNIDFDTIALRSVKDSTAVVLLTAGNDSLTIDKMIWFDGDSSSFVIDPQYFTTRKLPAGINYSIPIRFLGDTLGAHVAVIAVIHDAMPAYQRDTSFIELRGVVKNNDTSQFSLDILAPKEIVACTSEEIVITIKNTGNRPLQFQKITSSATNILIIPISTLSPQILQPDSAIQAVFSIEMSLVNNGIVSFIVQCNDTLQQSIEVTIHSTPNIVTFNTQQDTSQSPGESLDLPFSGTISTGASMPFQFRMSLSLHYQILDVIKTSDTLELTDSIHTYRIPVSIFQERTRVIVSSDSIFMLNAGITSWKTKVSFNIMLSQFDVCEILTELSDTLHPCFSPAKGDRTVHINEVCANAFRKVAEAGVQFNIIRISPNPVGETGTAEITLQGDGIVKIDAVNTLGERIVIAEEYLKSGLYEIQFSTKNFANGVYGIIVRAADGRERRAMFVIER